MVKNQDVVDRVAKSEDAASPSLPTAVWLGDNTGDLSFCWERLRKITRIIHVDEAWMQGIDWSSLKPQFAFVGVNTRTDQIHQLMLSVEENWPKANRQVILGGWWSGHRRSFPLDETLDFAYWHQWWDIVLPTIAEQSGATKVSRKSKPMTRIERILARNPLNDSTMESRFALVVTEGATRRELWSDGLGSLGWHVVQVSPVSDSLVGHFDCVVLDVAGCSTALRSEQTDYWVRQMDEMSKRFRDARIIVIDNFPARDRWQRFEAAGAKVILPSPFRWRGFQLAG